MYPLTSGYRTTYWVLVGLMAVMIVANLAEGKITFPGILGIAMVIGLVKDAQIRKRLTVAIVTVPKG